MAITLTPEQQKRLEAAVAAGRFPSVEEAVRCAVDRLMAAGEENYGDLSWANPFLDQARAEIARGDTISLEAFNAHVEERLSKLR